jgi:hypothetical protein
MKMTQGGNRRRARSAAQEPSSQSARELDCNTCLRTRKRRVNLVTEGRSMRPHAVSLRHGVSGAGGQFETQAALRATTQFTCAATHPHDLLRPSAAAAQLQARAGRERGRHALLRKAVTTSMPERNLVHESQVTAALPARLGLVLRSTRMQVARQQPCVSISRRSASAAVLPDTDGWRSASFVNEVGTPTASGPTRLAARNAPTGKRRSLRCWRFGRAFCRIRRA